jgi:hypothetical protein
MYLPQMSKLGSRACKKLLLNEDNTCNGIRSPFLRSTKLQSIALSELQHKSWSRQR